MSRMECPGCQTCVEGCFQPSSFDRLPPESLAFVELFVRRKGNLKEMERELGVPYSTVRHRLDEVVRELGPTQDTAPTTDDASSDEASSEERQKILDRLQKGDITPDEAIKQLEGAE
ncbi:MAG: DUF2089 domain-containing protein [Gemmatimonadetes bacterium]|nr:DUF2089 domain-containing protein [Gemmatimonadota bacterium]MBT6147545.1 DUF2089 domain-containing protein [Gemmatimonadota bacterium]MBT7863978.1 DUF2089 domain-containing protein [Gemmatimonadota bacterium]